MAVVTAMLSLAGTPDRDTRLFVEQFMNDCAGHGVMANTSASRRRGEDEVNPKIDPAPNSNTEKAPDDWVSGNDPMTGAQASYLKTLSEECGETDAFASDLTKAEASKRIDALKSKRNRRDAGDQP